MERALLSEVQYDYLRHKLLERGLNYAPLVAEVIDHVCSRAEDLLAAGLPFDQAAHEALAGFNRPQLEEIQQTTFSLTTQHKHAMKTIRIGLLVSYALLFVGLFMKTLHLPGSNELLVLGIGFTGLFVIASLFFRYDTLGAERQQLPLTVFRIVFSLGVVLLSWGVLFTLLRFPLRYELTVGGLVLLALSAVLGLVGSQGIGFNLTSHRKLVLYNLVLPLGVIVAARLVAFVALKR